MSTTNEWTLMGEARVGRESQPGSPLHDVVARISRCGRRWRVDLKEQWGSNQGYRQVAGEREVSASDTDLHEAIGDARADAKDANMRMEYVVQALGQAQREAQEAEEDEPAGAQFVANADGGVLARRLVDLCQRYEGLREARDEAALRREIWDELQMIGRTLAFFGFDGMKAAHDAAEALVGNDNSVGYHLNHAWDMIGGWMA